MFIHDSPLRLLVKVSYSIETCHIDLLKGPTIHKYVLLNEDQI